MHFLSIDCCTCPHYPCTDVQNAFFRTNESVEVFKVCLKIFGHFSLQEGSLNLYPLSAVDLGAHSGRCDVLSLPRLGYKRLQLKSCLCSLSFFQLGAASCVSITRQPCRERLCWEELWPEVGLEVKPAPGWPLETAAPMKFDFNSRMASRDCRSHEV